ncbi:MAG: Hsp33 family molecular chaperone HslO [Alteromonadaceae bacterium]|jgi:molecular chaperone Hsp33|uniref:33 kDa chaperonin n=2 Tax=Paraglaciecola mesophila TaxID=197222 RepID=K6ZLB0_9ALTE|nr:Hsp33 family molecular chaperone HslO [Paraglaciecola mesophila]MAD18266.1 Hsp33 family molecular chaperone HslO [Alteromonadaceae bacterium]GAC24155.1 molecular chaperone Hsp33 [Paraglaciecola mesophila KMM 241]
MSFDQLHRYLFNQAHVRGELVRLENSYQSILDSYAYPPVIQKLLGELMAATSLLTATLKFEGDIALQLQSDGPVNYAVINGTHNQQLRGVARWDESLAELPDDFSQLFTKGILVITITPEDGERYQGMVALDKPTLAECIESYFQQSEQLATKVILRTQQTDSGAKACGMFLQILPTSSQATATGDTGFEHLAKLTETIKNEELFSLPAEDILYRLYHQEEIEVYPPADIIFKCSCSRERSANALAAVQKEELLDIVATEGAIKMNCQYCHREYRFDEIDVHAIHAGTFAMDTQSDQ